MVDKTIIYRTLKNRRGKIDMGSNGEIGQYGEWVV
jgi:hypothetical protein